MIDILEFQFLIQSVFTVISGVDQVASIESLIWDSQI